MNTHSWSHVSGGSKNVQVSWNTANHVHCIKVYPRKSADSSTVLLYGHNNGLRVVWIGGSSKERAGSTINNGRSTSLSNDHEPAASVDGQPSPQTRPGRVPRSENECLEGCSDTVPRALPAVQQLDIPLETEVLHLAVVPIAARPAAGVHEPSLLKRNIVVAVGCSDSTARVLSLPLDRPPENSNGTTFAVPPEGYVRTAVVPARPTNHLTPPNSVAVTWVSSSRGEPELIANEPSPSREDAQDYELLLASAGPDASGILLVTKIPIANSGSESNIPSGAYQPSRRVHLSSAPVDIAFNPAQPPSQRHNLLLIAERNGFVRVYNSTGHRSLPRRLEEQEGGVDHRQISRGTWQRVFSSPFESTSPSRADGYAPALVRRKSILAARWVDHGRAIFVMLSDGGYGLWESQDRPKNGIDAFTLHGHIGTSAVTARSGQQTALAHKMGQGRSSLAPMTPNTRAAKSERLFSASAPVATGSISPQGGLSVKARDGSGSDESVTAWYEGEVYIIANFQSFRTKSSRPDASMIGSSHIGPKLTRVDGLKLQGQSISSLDQLPLTERGQAMSHSQPDVIVATDHNLLFLLGKVNTFEPLDDASPLSKTADFNEFDLDEGQMDFDLLDKGQLGLPGIEKMAARFSKSSGRKVLFSS